MATGRDTFFAMVRENPFHGVLSQSQVDGLNILLSVWVRYYKDQDRRWLAYALATQLHEASMTCQPIEEYGKGQGMEYGEEDPETGQVYYGRGYIQCTWRENYRRADEELGLEGDDSGEWDASNQLRPGIAAATMYRGMIEGWFRSGHDLPRYFNETEEEPYLAREIVNGDKHYTPDWAHGESIGNIIAGYYGAFLAAIDAALADVLPPQP